MRSLGLLIVGLVLAQPVPALAQAVQPADLIGQWTRPGEKALAFALRADSTFTIIGIGAAGTRRLDMAGRWHMAGDTLLLTQTTVQMDGYSLESSNLRGKPPSNLTRLVKLEGRRLTLTAVKAGGPQRVYTRLDTPAP